MKNLIQKFAVRVMSERGRKILGFLISLTKSMLFQIVIPVFAISLAVIGIITSIYPSVFSSMLFEEDKNVDEKLSSEQLEHKNGFFLCCELINRFKRSLQKSSGVTFFL